MNQLATTRPRPPSRQSTHASVREISPLGKGRFAVRGLALSNSRSTIRLNAIAQVRAQTIAARTRPNVRQPGQPRRSRAATSMDASANGRAKTVWENLTNPAHLMNAENIERRTSNFNPHQRMDNRWSLLVYASVREHFVELSEYWRQKFG